SAFKAWIGDGKQFKKGRDASAALGIVPRQHSSGGKNVLLGITKKGDCYLRSLVIHGARSVVRMAANKTDELSRWINALVERRGKNRATVALANKLVRIAWVLVVKKETYQAS
ncbi:transposase, partial [Oceaniserpentilla sp. 4NH20-0058]|uniref:transposase n=1 Tax=Oceaniserpentilla sp. 4NH20-0058 TaxID=3127660 RepID=UPI003342D0F6